MPAAKRAVATAAGSQSAAGGSSGVVKKATDGGEKLSVGQPGAGLAFGEGRHLFPP